MPQTRRLHLVRHAKAAPAEPGQPDYDRVLDRQGEADAMALGRRLESAGLRPAFIVSSGSARTRGTLQGLMTAFGTLEQRFDDELYRGDEDSYLEIASACEGDVLLLGHNPMIGSLARRLAVHGEEQLRRSLAQGFPTAALATLRFDTPDGWRNGTIENLLLPPHRAG